MCKKKKKKTTTTTENPRVCLLAVCMSVCFKIYRETYTHTYQHTVYVCMFQNIPKNLEPVVGVPVVQGYWKFLLEITKQWIRDRKTQPTEFYPPKFGLESEANRGWYLFLRNLLTGGIRDLWFFKVSLFDDVFDRNHHYNLDFSCSEKCAQKRTKIIQILVGKIRWGVFFLVSNYL